jgi:hypothetical protein
LLLFFETRLKLQMQLWFLICLCGILKLYSCKRDRTLWIISGLFSWLEH